MAAAYLAGGLACAITSAWLYFFVELTRDTEKFREGLRGKDTSLCANSALLVVQFF